MKKQKDGWIYIKMDGWIGKEKNGWMDEKNRWTGKNRMMVGWM